MEPLALNIRYLRALLHIAATKDIRYYLNGVQVIACPQRGKLYAATDGHRAAVLHEAWPENEQVQSLELIIPREVPAKVKSAKRLDHGTLTHVSGLKYALDNGDGLAVQFDVIDAKFPDWSRVFPTETSGAPGAYNWQYLANFNDMVQDATGSNRLHSCDLYQNGAESVALVRHPALDFVGAVMPLRGNKQDDAPGLPAWFNITPPGLLKAA